MVAQHTREIPHEEVDAGHGALHWVSGLIDRITGLDIGYWGIIGLAIVGALFIFKNKIKGFFK